MASLLPQELSCKWIAGVFEEAGELNLFSFHRLLLQHHFSHIRRVCIESIEYKEKFRAFAYIEHPRKFPRTVLLLRRYFSQRKRSAQHSHDSLLATPEEMGHRYKGLPDH